MTNSDSRIAARGEEWFEWAGLALVGVLVSGPYLYYAATTSWFVAQRYDADNMFWWLLPVVAVSGNLAAAARIGTNAFATWGVRLLFAALTAGAFFAYLHGHLAELEVPVTQWVWPPCGAVTGMFGLQIVRLSAERRPWRPADSQTP
ncbi:hypothetical protein F7Q99_29960 [Streptomyces kaniharaensis]|uniref:Uncharacterized protein n=1 Tax=Streptomyces kaniharaensis TaxID=212423 RepID=A0A6N7KXB1_9ACTN|nr:hypothetical protein [Streptomyces kaniharaensis]MQS16326.1 hypothetical protein [Streptomyces kaniharaensis]